MNMQNLRQGKGLLPFVYSSHSKCPLYQQISTFHSYLQHFYYVNHHWCKKIDNIENILFIFLAFDFCRFCVVIRFFHPATTANDMRLRGFSIPDFIHYILFSYLNSWERASMFPIECSVLNKGTTGTIFITSLVWRGPWLGIEPGTSHTWYQHYTTRLPRRR